MPQLHGGKNQQSHHHQQKEHQQEQAQNLLNFLSMYIKLTVMQILLQHLVHIQRHIIFFVLIFQMLDSKMNDIVSLYALTKLSAVLQSIAVSSLWTLLYPNPPKKESII